MEPLLRIAEELERRDEDAAAALRVLEALRREVEETRVHAASVAAFVAAYPDALAARRAEERAAAESRDGAAAALAAAEAALAEAEERGREDARLAATRAVHGARDVLREAELRVQRAQDARARLERERRARLAEAEALERRAAELGGRIAALPRVAVGPPGPADGPGLEGVLAWCSRARGALLLAHAGLAAERDTVVREASELAASALGEPLPAGGVAALRARLATG